MVIQTIQLVLSEPNWTDSTAHVTRFDSTGANQSDAEHPPTDLAVGVRVSRGAPPKALVRSSMSVLTRLVLILFGPVWFALVDDQAG
jgi:hypothetical protein